MERTPPSTLFDPTPPPAASRGGYSVLAPWLVIVVLGLLVRALLVAFGRTTVLDGFYLHGAWRLSIGDSPYHDFVHVAFPLVEWLYSLALRLDGDLLTTASIVSGIAVIVTALLITELLRRAGGNAAAIAGGVLYLTSAHLASYHAFEREIWTNLFLACAAFFVLATDVISDRRVALVGAAMAGALLSKLTAAIGVIALLIVLWRRSNARTALTAAGLCGAFGLSATLLAFACWGAEFTTQVFAFYFWKGEAGTATARLTDLLRAADPALALGFAGAIGVARLAISHAFRWMLGAWLFHYVVISPSFWDHNCIDFLLPCAALGGLFVGGAIATRSWPRLALALLLVVLGSHVFEPRASRWLGFPHGFGADVSRYLALEGAVIDAHSEPEDFIVAPNPLTAALAGRRPFVSDFELEPVARGVLRELRFRGFSEAMARRADRIVLGMPEARPLEAQSASGNRFADRVIANTLAHVMPRVLDAAARRELALVLAGALPPNMRSVFATASYRPLPDPHVPGFSRD